MYRIKLPVLAVFITILFLGLIYNSHASITVEVKEQYLVDKMDCYVDTTSFPILSARIRASQDGNQVTLKISDVFIIENNRCATPVSVNQPDLDGWQKVSWYTKITGAPPVPSPPAPKIFLNTGIIVSLGNELGHADAPYFIYSASKIIIRNPNYTEEPEYFMGIVKAGSTNTRRVKIIPYSARIINKEEQPIMVDSVKTHSPFFKLSWIGSVLTSKEPPIGMVSPFNYDVDVTFQPNTNDYYADKLTVYYEGGRKEEINLYGNNFVVERKTVLNLIQPNGGEILTPCQDYLVKWKGNVLEMPTIVEYSPDDGATWKEVAHVSDSSQYLWKVPKDISDNVLLRVRQDFQNTRDYPLKINGTPVRKISYRSDGIKLLAVNDAGEIPEWDLNSFTLSKKFSTNSINPGQGQTANSFGLSYIDSGSKFVLGYYIGMYYQTERQDSLLFFDTTGTSPYLRVGLDKSFRTKEMAIDSKKQILALVPEDGKTMMILSAKDGSLIKYVDFPYPISGFSFSANDDKAVIAFINGEVRLLSVPDFNTIKTFDFSDLPIIEKTSISPNGKFIAIGCQPPTTSYGISNKNEIHVIDIATGYIIRSVRNTSSNTVGLEFNPSSSVLLVGSSTQPQLSFWDLPSSSYIGSMIGSDGTLNDLAFSPEGHSLAVSSSASGDNLNIRTFTYPEFDNSDGSFRIVPPVIKTTGIKFDNVYLADTNKKEYTANFCNTGIVPLVLGNSRMQFDKYFHLMEQLAPDTLQPGQCASIKINFCPQDTGKMVDTLIISTCFSDYKIALDGYSMNRHITFMQNIFDFGELCVGDTIVKDIVLARNDDPVPLRINQIYISDIASSPFRFVNTVNDTVLGPGSSIAVKIRFTPKDLGEALRKVTISHSGLPNFDRDAMLKGLGIGTILESSHNDLRFIPEITNRKFRIVNKSNKTVSINKAVFNPQGIYTMISSLPVTLNPGDSAFLEVKWNGNDDRDVSMLFEAVPCVAHNNITIGQYKANSIVSMPQVQADPKGDAVIPVTFENVETKPYNGTRFFETEFAMNPRMFLPEFVTSSYGKAELTRNEIIGDKRIIGLRVEGDFNLKGTLAEVHGIAGLAETDTTTLVINKDAKFWGKAITTKANDGMFRLINVCQNKFLIQSNKTVMITSVSPNPSSDYVNVKFDLKEAGQCSVELYDNLGTLAAEPVRFDAKEGTIVIPLKVNYLLNGTYKLVVRQGASFDVSAVVVVR